MPKVISRERVRSLSLLIIVVSAMSVGGIAVSTTTGEAASASAITLTNIQDDDGDGNLADFTLQINADTRVCEWSYLCGNGEPYFKVTIGDYTKRTPNVDRKSGTFEISVDASKIASTAKDVTITVELYDEDLDSDGLRNTWTKTISYEPINKDLSDKEMALRGIESLAPSYTEYATTLLNKNYWLDNSADHIENAAKATVPTSSRDIGMEVLTHYAGGPASATWTTVQVGVWSGISFFEWKMGRLLELSNGYGEAGYSEFHTQLSKLAENTRKIKTADTARERRTLIENREELLRQFYKTEQRYLANLRATIRSDEGFDLDGALWDFFEVNMKDYSRLKDEFNDLEKHLITDYYWTQIYLNADQSSYANLTNAVTTPPVLSPKPDITKVSAPSTVRVGESFTITVTATNNGVDATYQSIAVSFPDATSANAISITDTDFSNANYATVFPSGTSVGHKYGLGSTVQSKYPLAEVGGPWATDQTKSLTLTVTPKESGTYTFYVKSVAKDGGWESDPAIGETATTDQQSEYVYTYTVTVTGDRDNDGLLNSEDPCPDDANCDGDGWPDDTDPTPETQNTDGVGATDGTDSETKANTDGDDTNNYADRNNDNDGWNDGVDPTPLTANTDKTWQPDGFNSETKTDTDGDGTANYADTNNDADAWPDAIDPTPVTPNTDSTWKRDGVAGETTRDTDNDGTPNYADPDNDGDSVPDGTDPQPLGTNADGDGWSDSTDPTPNTANTDTTWKQDGIGGETKQDTDGDGIANYADADNDGDGYTDSSEAANGSNPLNKTSTPAGPNTPPTAAFSYTPTNPNTTTTVTFTASAATDDTGIQSYAWDILGDSNTDQAGESITHTFSEAGEYTVTLTVTDGNGSTDTITKTILVTSPAEENTTTDPTGYTYRVPYTLNTQKLSGAMASSLFVTATDNTTIKIDRDGDGTIETTRSVTSGEATRIAKPKQGLVVTAAQPLNVRYEYRTSDFGAYEDGRFSYGIPEAGLLGTEYYVPVSPDALYIMAAEHTTVRVDKDADGVSETVRTLTTNEILRVEHPAQGTHVTATGRIQVVAQRARWSNMDYTYLVTLDAVSTAASSYTLPAEPPHNTKAATSKTGVYLIATQPNTTVQADIGRDGSIERTLSLDRGDVQKIEFTQATRVTATNPLIAVYTYHVRAQDWWGTSMREYIAAGTPGNHIEIQQGSWAGKHYDGGINAWGTYTTPPQQPVEDPPAVSAFSADFRNGTLRVTFTSRADLTNISVRLTQQNQRLETLTETDFTHKNGTYIATYTPAVGVDGNITATLRTAATEHGDAATGQQDTLRIPTTRPAISFTYTPSTPVSGETITFTATTPDTIHRIQSVQWNFDADGDIEATGRTVTNAFPAGDHQVTVQVLTATNRTVTHTRLLTVTEGTNASLRLTGTSSSVIPGGDMTITFNLTNTQSTAIGAALDVTLPPTWTVTAKTTAGGYWKNTTQELIWPSIAPQETVHPSMTVTIPESAAGTYTVHAEATPSSNLNQTIATNITIHVGGKPVISSIAGSNGRISTRETLRAVTYWKRGTTVPGTGHKIGIRTLLDVISHWKNRTPVGGQNSPTNTHD
ncbi:PKD domain-containing protein [Salarchaeum sp. JOR-1]|uniref:PKD domain-containing protein n=1 Tax=Salarchaeum sp. JOR-1 TaxID=2599399 RepID=UPI0011982C18|nr:PKD domain-containing protein [Salarchaeum sp. JOR-1]QDX40796.1 PKD domain-containing protein [Salarchaeum sp. JOR-1]